MSWASIALLLLQIANQIVTYLNSRKLMDAGADAEIAKASAAILSKTEYARQTRERIDALPRDTVDVLLGDLTDFKPN